MSEEFICIGCGVTIQTENPNEIGYAPASSLKREDVLCKRCFRLKNYNETQEVSITDDDFFEMVRSIRDTNGIVVYIVDVFDVSGSMIHNLPRIVGNRPIMLVGNKIDLLPKSTNHRKVEQWLRKMAKEAGVRVIDTHLVSSKKGTGLKELTHALENHRKGKDVYIVGTTNVGKSTFVNQVIAASTGMNHVVTTSYFPGTTLGFIEIPLDDQTFLIDTPGIVNRHQMIHYLSEEDVKKITPKKEVKARVYQLESEQTLFIGGLVRIDFTHGEKQSFVCYFSNDIPIHRTKLSNADELYQTHIGKMLAPPDAQSLATLPELREQSFKIPEANTDVVLPGLGWITFPKGNCSVHVYSPVTVPASVRKSFL
ncbi:MAG TPA: ribosome biogenesis GTPase YqeH [Virgibacillus sp.]|nr:ribosome biogenesis GTPase YqeH [Virgibacillus sp.]